MAQVTRTLGLAGQPLLIALYKKAASQWVDKKVTRAEKKLLNILFIDGRKVALLNFVTQLAKTRLECLNKNVRNQPSMNT